MPVPLSPVELNSATNDPTRNPTVVRSVQSWDFDAATPFDFFSAMYFLIARRLLFFLRLCESFRASCFMLILLARRDKPAGCLQTGVPHGEELATLAVLESRVAVRKFSHEALIKGTCMHGNDPS